MPCRSASSVVVVPIPTIAAAVCIPVTDVVNALEPPPPAILISIALPVLLNVLPAPTKLRIRTVPIPKPPD